MLKELNIEGIVTNVNQKLLQFTLNEDLYVYICMSFNNRSARLPKLQEHVTIKKGNCSENPFGGKTIVLCENSVASFDSLEDITNILNADTVFTSHEFGIEDFKQMDIFYHLIKKCFAWMESLIRGLEEVVLNLISNLLKEIPEPSETDNRSSKLLSRFFINSISDCIYVDYKTEKTVEELSYWSFGAHYLEQDEFIIGYLFIEMQNYGMLMIRDHQHGVPIFIVNNDSNQNFCQFIGTLVLIKKCTTISEIYKDHKIDNFEYIIVDFNDIEILIDDLYDDRYFKKAFSISRSMEKTYQNWITLTVLSKSTTIYSLDDQPERWVEVSLHFMDDEGSILRFRSKDFEVSAALTVGTRYKFCYNGQLKCLSNYELQRFFPQHTLYEVPQIYTFHKIESGVLKEEIISVKQCVEYISKNPTGLICFSGKVKYKKFNDPLSSRTQRQISTYGFGTPGPKTHVIEFEVEGEKVKTLTLYLNNWESMLMPFGLIPDMQIIVRNVAQQKGKYLKSTAMTSFELLSYKPQVPFESVNLYSKATGDIWGKPYYFSLGNSIPYGVIIWCPINKLSIKTLKIQNVCGVCGKICNKITECCDSNPILTTTIVMIVTDDMGEAKVISKSPGMLQLLLNFTPQKYEEWLETFQLLGLFEYSSNECCSLEDEDEESSDPEDQMDEYSREKIFRTAMLKHIKNIEETEPCNLKLLCKKMNSKMGENEQESVWFCLKART